MPRLAEIEHGYREAGETVHFIGVSIDQDLERLDRMLEAKAVPWPTLCDGVGGAGEIPKRYHVTATPTLWLIDAAGRIVLESRSVDEVEERLAELVH